VPVIQRQELMTMVGLLAGCRVFIGHDSGLTHLAGAMQVPTVAVFGPTDPRQWAPVGAHVSVIVGNRCFCPTWDEVKTCVSKSCLSVSPSAIIEACRFMVSRSPSVTTS
jgi:ADP-heptose:LPS heptosyltransferase